MKNDENHIIGVNLPAPGSGSGAHSMPSSIFLSRWDIQDRICDLARDIDEHYGRQPAPFTLLVVMDGAMVFAADLMRRVRTKFIVQTVKCKSYKDGKSGEHLKITSGGKMTGSQILIVEDIIESGRTMKALRRRIMIPDREIKIVSLIERKHHAPVADWIGFRTAPGYIYGYGLDAADGTGRGLKDLWVMGVDKGRSR